MAIELPELIELRDTLMRNRAKGVRSLQINGERVEFVTDADFARRISDLNGQIAALQGQADAPFTVMFPNLGRGL